LLQEEPFSASYAHSAERGAHRLTRLRVGAVPSELPLSPERREEAILAIDPSGEGLVQLFDVIRDDGAPGVRRAAILQLEESSDAEIIDVLFDALDDPDLDVVLVAVEALERRGDPSVIPRLEEMLGEPRVQAAPELSDAVGAAIDWLLD
jgi:HEAT repeat protein